MAQRTCSIGDCDKVVRSRDWCDMHYRRWWKYGDPLLVKKRGGRKSSPTPSTQCTGPECVNLVGAQSKTGLCRTHQAQRRRGAIELTPIKMWSRSNEWPIGCSVDGCDRPHGAKGMCDAHRNRVLKGLPATEPIKPSIRRLGCLVESCEKIHFSGAYCKRHYSLLVSRYRVYGITREDADRMLEAQGGACAICRRPASLAELAIDHDHNCCPKGGSCGACVRGLLCGLCNLGLGSFRDDPKALTNAIQYLSPTSAAT